ncbi:MAG: hypothetical protein WAO55_09530 [Candidatus Manganitrophaceae bacterium]
MVFVFFPGLIQAAEPGKTLEGIREEKRFLETELSLVKKGEVYAVLDLPSRKFLFKIRTLLMKEIPIAEIDLSNEKAVSKPAYVLIQKDPPFPSLQKEIQSPSSPNLPTASPESPPADRSFVTVEDMPSRYTLSFEEGLTIRVISSRPECACGWLRDRLDQFTHSTTTFLWETNRWIKERRRPDLRLTLSVGEAKALFWSLSEGNTLLILSSRTPR